jgi:MFS family permease
MDEVAAGRAKRVLFFALVSAGVGQSFLFAVLPPLGREMGFAEVEIGAIVTVSALVFVACAPIWGMLNERWGRRAAIVTGLFFSGATTALFAAVIELRLAGTLGVGAALALLIGFRVVFAATASGVFPAAQAYIADITPASRRAQGFAILGAAFGLGMVGGPGLAWGMSEISLVAPFFGIAVLSALAGIATILWLREPQHTTSVEPHQNDSGLRGFVRIFPYLTIATLTMCTLAIVQQVTGFRFQDLFALDAEATARQAGLALMVMAALSILAQIALVQRLSWPPTRLLRLGALLALGAIILLLLLETFVPMVVAMALLGAGLGLVFPSYIALMSNAAGSAVQGRIAGINASAQGLGFVIGPIAGSALYQLAPEAPYFLALGLVSIIALLAFVLRAPSASGER